ncbi:hypothetical protein ACQJBY_051080 [Aegilops geniculata]
MSVLMLDVITSINPPLAHLGTGFVAYFRRRTVLIITNEHVVQGAIFVRVRLPGGSQEFTGEVLEADNQVDLAIVRLVNVEGPFQPMVFADVSIDNFPWTAYAHGYFLVLGAPVINPARAPGEINGAFFRNNVHYLQGDFALQHGMSGGPVTMGNRVIGVSTAVSWGQSVIISLHTVHVTLMFWCGLNDGDPTIDEMLEMLAAGAA